jgi:hypothetical protein
MGRTFRTRYNEHTREIRTSGQSSKFAQHILNTAHNYDIMDKSHGNTTYLKKRTNVKHIKFLYM